MTMELMIHEKKGVGPFDAKRKLDSQVRDPMKMFFDIGQVDILSESCKEDLGQVNLIEPRGSFYNLVGRDV